MNMELYVYPPKNGLPTFDFDCLVTLIYAQLASVPCSFHASLEPSLSPSGTLPLLRIRHKRHDELIYGRKDILSCWIAEGAVLHEESLNVQQMVERRAFLSLIEGPLLEAFSWHYFVALDDDDDHRHHLMERDQNYFLMRRQHWRQHFKHLYPTWKMTEKKERVICSNQLLSRARSLLQLFNDRLGGQREDRFLMGTNRPSDVDILLYAIMMLFKCTLPDITGQTPKDWLLPWSHLCRFLVSFQASLPCFDFFTSIPPSISSLSLVTGPSDKATYIPFPSSFRNSAGWLPHLYGLILAERLPIPSGYNPKRMNRATGPVAELEAEMKRSCQWIVPSVLLGTLGFILWHRLVYIQVQFAD